MLWISEITDFCQQLSKHKHKCNVNGKELCASTVVRNKAWTPEYAKAMTILDGLQEAFDRGYRDCVIESGCYSVINALQLKTFGLSPLVCLFHEILQLSMSLEHVLLDYVNRVNNLVAHALADAPRFVGKTDWIDALSLSVLTAVIIDLSSILYSPSDFQ